MHTGPDVPRVFGSSTPRVLIARSCDRTEHLPFPGSASHVTHHSHAIQAGGCWWVSFCNGLVESREGYIRGGDLFLVIGVAITIWM